MSFFFISHSPLNMFSKLVLSRGWIRVSRTVLYLASLNQRVCNVSFTMILRINDSRCELVTVPGVFSRIKSVP